jgi:TonB family protein
MELPPRIEPYDLLYSLALGSDRSVYAVTNRETGVRAALWLSEAPFDAPAVSHPNLLEVRACGVRDGYDYRVTEPVEETLGDRLAAQGPLPPECAISMVVGVARALSALIAAGDSVAAVAASDVALGADGTPKVIPFTLPRAAEADTGVGRPTPLPPGTPASLMASLGALYAELLTGRPTDPSDPLARAASEILRGLVSCELTRDGTRSLRSARGRGGRSAARGEGATGRNDETSLVVPSPSRSLAPSPSSPALPAHRRVPLLVPVTAGGLGVALVAAGVALGLHLRGVLPGPMANLPAAVPPAARAEAPRATRPSPARTRPARRRPAGVVRVAERPRVGERRVRVARQVARADGERGIGRPASARRLKPRATMAQSRPAPANYSVREGGPGAFVARGFNRWGQPGPSIAVQKPAVARTPGFRTPRPRKTPTAIPRSPRPPASRLVIARALPAPALGSRAAGSREEWPAAWSGRRSEESRTPSGVPLVRLKVTVDEAGRVENAVVVDSCGDERRDLAAVSAMNGRRIALPGGEEASAGSAHVAYATVAVASPASARLVRAYWKRSVP